MQKFTELERRIYKRNGEKRFTQDYTNQQDEKSAVLRPPMEVG